MKTTGPESKQVLENRGKRLRMVRSFFYPIRSEFSTAIEAKDVSVKTWENGTGYGLRPKSAQKIINFLENKGMLVSLDWLMNGDGLGPTVISLAPDTTLNTISQENQLSAFSACCEAILPSQTISLHCPDNSMSPRYLKGDLVAGPTIDLVDISKYQNQTVIVNFKSQTLLRKLMLQDNGSIALISSAPDKTENESLLLIPREDISKLAPVLMHINVDALR